MSDGQNVSDFILKYHLEPGRSHYD